MNVVAVWRWWEMAMVMARNGTTKLFDMLVNLQRTVEHKLSPPAPPVPLSYLRSSCSSCSFVILQNLNTISLQCYGDGGTNVTHSTVTNQERRMIIIHTILFFFKIHFNNGKIIIYKILAIDVGSFFGRFSRL
jgi:hypothetical protein